jgi:hypothetical protein
MNLLYVFKERGAIAPRLLALLRSPYLGELGSDGRSEPPPGCQAARAQHLDDAACARGVGARRRRGRYRGDLRRDGGSERVNWCEMLSTMIHNRSL